MLSCVLVVLQFILLTIPASASNIGIEKAVQDELKSQFRFDSSYDGVMEDASGNYALVVEDPSNASPVLLPAGYLQVDLLNPASVNEALTHPNLSAEIKATIGNMAQTAEPCTECDTCNRVSIFSPDLLPQTRSQTTSYYTYNGTRMKVDQIQRDDHTNYADIVSGAGNRFVSTANVIYNIGMGIGGMVNAYVSIFGVGMTLLDAVFNHSNVNSVSAVSNSQIQARVLFNGVTRYTYAYIEDWRIGCVSHSAYVQSIQFDYVLYRNDERKFVGNFLVGVNINKETESYSNHWAVARNNYHSPKVDDIITLGLGTKTFNLKTLS